MLPEGAHVRSAYLDPDSGILSAFSTSTAKLLIDSSTIDTSTNLYIKEQVLKKSPQSLFYDAPVSGGVIGAVDASMAFFLGCSESDPNVSRLTTLLSTMGGKVIPCGGPSLGLSAKLSNNYLSGAIAIACSEAMDMGTRAGVDAHVLASVFGAGTAQNTICDRFNPVLGVCPNPDSLPVNSKGSSLSHQGLCSGTRSTSRMDDRLDLGRRREGRQRCHGSLGRLARPRELGRQIRGNQCVARSGIVHQRQTQHPCGSMRRRGL